MNSPLAAMLWELWRVSRWELGLRIAGMSLITIALCGFANASLGEAETAVVRSVMLLMLLSGSLFSYTWLSSFDNHPTAFAFRLGFTRPISTERLVLIPLWFGVAAAMVCFLIPALLMRAFLGPAASLPGLTVFVGALVACLMTGSWAPSSRWGQWTLVCLVLIAVILMLVKLHSTRAGEEPWLMAMGRPGYFPFNVYYYIACLLLVAGASWLTIEGVRRKRFGEGWFETDGWWQSSHDEVPARETLSEVDVRRFQRKPFSGSWQAQFWLEMHAVGRVVLPTAILIPLFPMAFVTLGPLMAAEEKNWDDAPIFWLLAILTCPLMYQLVGVNAAIGLRMKQANLQLSAFDATRPLTNDFQIFVKLVTTAAFSMVGMLFMAATAAAHALAAGHGAQWRRVMEALASSIEAVPPSWAPVTLVSLLFVYISSSSMLLAFGLLAPKYPYRFFGLMIFGSANVLVALADGRHDLIPAAVWNGYGYLIALAIVGVCGFILMRAYQAGLVASPYFIAAFVLWCVYVGCTSYSYLELSPRLAEHITAPTAALPAMAASLLTPLAATALAPLALAAHRHG